MPKVVLDNITSGYSSTTKINANNDRLEAAIDNTLSRDGSTPNQMEAPIDMNSNRIINVGAPQGANDAARYSDIAGLVDITGVVAPSQTGNSGRYLGTDGTLASWSNPPVYIARTAAEISAGITPTSYSYEPGDVRRYGAVGDGVTDDTAAISAAASTGLPITMPYGTFLVSSPVTISSSITGSGADDGQTTIVLTGTGRLVVGDEQCTWSGFVMQSNVNNIIYIRCPVSSFTARKFRIVETGAPTGQIGIQFDTTNNSIYFARVSDFKIRCDYPIDIIGDGTEAFNANVIGTGQSEYFQNFESAISVGNVIACDANQFCGYFEVGTNVLNNTIVAFRQNRIRAVADAVTRVYNGGAAVVGANLWEILDGGFTTGGTYPQNQILIGPPSTKVRATQSAATAIANATATILTYDAEAFDTLSEFSNGTGVFTAKNAGYYRIVGGAKSASVAWDVGERWEVRIYKNGTEYAAGNYDRADAAVTNQRSSYVSALVFMNGTTDTVDLRIIHNQGASVNTDTAPTANFIEIERVS